MSEEVQVVWREEKRTLVLEGEPVLTYSLSWPKVEGGGLGGRWISRYYSNLAKSWRRRWEREVYWAACLALSARRETARPFTPWSGELAGETALLRDGVLSLRFQGCEVRGDGRPARVRWGDVWTVREGAPKLLHSLFRGEKGWKGRLWRAPGGGAPPGGGLLSGRRLAPKGKKSPAPPRLVPDGGGGGDLPAPMRRGSGGGGLPGVHPAAGGKKGPLVKRAGAVKQYF